MRFGEGEKVHNLRVLHYVQPLDNRQHHQVVSNHHHAHLQKDVTGAPIVVLSSWILL